MDQKIFKQRDLNKLEPWQYMELEPFRKFYELYEVHLKDRFNLRIESPDVFFDSVMVGAFLNYDNKENHPYLYRKYKASLIENCTDANGLYELAKMELTDNLVNILSASAEVVSHYERLGDFELSVKVKPSDKDNQPFINIAQLKDNLLISLLDQDKADEWNVLFGNFSVFIFDEVRTNSKKLLDAKKWIDKHIVNQPNDEVVQLEDLSNSRNVDKVLYMIKLGLLDAIRDQHPTKEINPVAEIVSAITGIELQSVYQLVRTYFNDPTDGRNPQQSKKAQQIVSSMLSRKGFTPTNSDQ